MGTKRWRRAEKRIAELLNGERVVSPGLAVPDVIAQGFAIESKSRESFPKWLLDAMEQARRNTPGGLKPAVVLTQAAPRGGRCVRLAVLDFEEFVRLVMPNAA